MKRQPAWHRAAWPAPDFVLGRRRPALAWWLLALGLMAAAAVGWDASLSLQAEASERQAQAQWHVAGSRRWAGTAAAAPAATAATPTAAAGNATWRIVESLRHPWPRLLAGVDRASLPGLQWLALSHQQANPPEAAALRLEGLVPDADTAASLVHALAAQPGLAQVVLTRLAAPEGQAAAGQRFEIAATVEAAGLAASGAPR